jgi:mono/diheme cytochrome c family protein
MLTLRRRPSLAVSFAVAAVLSATAGPTRAADAAQVERGRYLVTIAGCNDCHTPGYTMANGDVPEALWLTGDRLGWRGPWGTTYGTNLRLMVADMDEAQWLHHVSLMEPRPPMPWFNLRRMSRKDLSAVFQYIEAMGPAGTAAPDYVPPGQQASGPTVDFPK